MMLKEKSNPWARTKYLYALPLACLAMLAFAHPDVAQAERSSVQKVNDLLALAQSETTKPETSSSDKFNEISEKNKQSSKSQWMAYADNPTPSQTPAERHTPIKGKVLSSTDGRALPFVNIIEKDASGRYVGHTTSKEDGSFEMMVKSSKNSLQYSCVGFQSAVCPIKEDCSIELEENKLSIDETLVESDKADTDNAEYRQPAQVKRRPRLRKLPEAPVEENLLLEELPEYPNGQSALIDYLKQTARYPKNAKAKGAEGKVVCSCIINTNGEVTNIQVVNPIDPELDKEAIRIVENMPSWTPGRQNGKNIAVKYLIPITFKIKK